jgi:glycolate oxidase
LSEDRVIPRAEPGGVTLVEALRAAVPDGVLTEAEDLIAYGFDGTFYERTPPLVVLPVTTAQVSAVHRIATERRVAITPRAMGSGLSGGAVPLGGSIVLGVARMDRILEIDPVDRVAVVQAGVINARLQAEVEQRGLFYPPDPSSLKQSAIGGNVAENAGGARCLKYGVTGDYVLALEVVLPDGTVIRTGGRTVKNVTGYDLRRLFTGAEGTLGTITEITLRLLSKPAFARAATAAFDRIEDAANATTAVMASGVLPAAIELVDNLTMRCVEANAPIGLPLDADALLIFGVDGNDERVLADDLATIERIVREHGARDVRIAESDAESERLWAARRSISPALARRRPNKLGEDVCIPPRALAALIRRVREIAVEYALEIPIFGHIGDGNLHPNILCDKRDPEEMQRVAGAARAIFETTVELGGTLSGEHGIGLLKKQFMELDVGADTLAVMRTIKDAIDPLGIMNPGKVFPDPGGADAFRL